MTAQARKLRGGAEQPESGEDRQNAEQPVSWLELFFDLVFVTAFDRLAQRLLTHPDLPTLGIFALIFVALWWAWIGNTNFAARYGSSSRVYRWGTLAQMVALAGLAVSVRGDLTDVGSFFALAYAVGRLLLVGMLLLRGRQQPEGVSAGDRLLIVGFLVGAAIWVVSAWADSTALRLLLWGLALTVDLAVVLYSERRTSRDLPHQGHFPERVGLLFIVFLGAVVTELVRGAAEQRLKLADQWPAALAILTIMALWRLYFDEAHTLPALLAKRSGKAGNLLAWSYVHLPLNMALSVLSVGLGLGIAEEGKAADREERLLVSASLAMIFLCLFALRALSLRALHRQAGPELQPTTAGERGTLSSVYSLSAVARLGGAAALLALIPAPLSTTVYETCAAAVTLLVALLSWRDPLRAELAEIEEELSEEAEQQGTENGGAGNTGTGNTGTGNTGTGNTGDLNDAKGTGRIGQDGH